MQVLAKNLFVKDKKSKQYLVVVRSDRKVDMNKLGKQLVARALTRHSMSMMMMMMHDDVRACLAGCEWTRTG